MPRMEQTPGVERFSLSGRIALVTGSTRGLGLEIARGMAAAGATVGIAFAFERILRQPNTIDAHRLIAWAQAQGAADALVEALFRAYFLDGRYIGDHEVLAAVAGEAGLDVDAARPVARRLERLDEESARIAMDERFDEEDFGKPVERCDVHALRTPDSCSSIRSRYCPYEFLLIIPAIRRTSSAPI